MVACFAVIGVLPRIFFRRGTFNRGWWLTALPFFWTPVFLLVAAVAGWRPWFSSAWSVSVAGLLALASVGLLCMTLGTHRVPLALWHQDDDPPTSIVTYGAYARIRHPFYTSFLLSFAAAFFLFPHVVTLLPLLYAAGRLNATAAREERRLSASEFGPDYIAYLSRTGRFTPRRGPTEDSGEYAPPGDAYSPLSRRGPGC
jgi:protein-S-isoprenylcysteine O-methyltransferase Ste14